MPGICQARGSDLSRRRREKEGCPWPVTGDIGWITEEGPRPESQVDLAFGPCGSPFPLCHVATSPATGLPLLSCLPLPPGRGQEKRDHRGASPGPQTSRMRRVPQDPGAGTASVPSCRPAAPEAAVGPLIRNPVFLKIRCLPCSGRRSHVHKTWKANAPPTSSRLGCGSK